MAPVTVGGPPVPEEAPAAAGAFSDPYPITVAQTAAVSGRQICQGEGLLCGWALIEPSGTSGATVELYDGMDTTAQLLAVANIPAAGSAPLSLGGAEPHFREGIFLNVLTGTVRGVIWAQLKRAS